jgi:hypothetical protein
MRFECAAVGHSSEILFVIPNIFPDRTHTHPLGRDAHLAWCGHADKNCLVYLNWGSVIGNIGSYSG